MYPYTNRRVHWSKALMVILIISFTSSVFANEESTRNLDGVQQANAINYNNNNVNSDNANNINVDDSNNHLNMSEEYSKDVEQEVMPNYKKVKKDSNVNVNSLNEKSGERINNVSAANSVNISIQESSDNVIENMLRDTASSTFNGDDNSEKTFADTITESVNNQNKFSDVNSVSSNLENLDKNDSDNESLPDIKDMPTLTITELPLEFLDSSPPLSSILIENDHHEQRNKNSIAKDKLNNNVTVEDITIVEGITGEILKENEIVKINDSGGPATSDNKNIDNSFNAENKDIVIDDNIIKDIPLEMNQTNTTVSDNPVTEMLPLTKEGDKIINDSSNRSAIDKQDNLTVTEEIPIPVFSEWAQKQMEAAEKQAALEQQGQTFNHSAQRKNHTKNGNGKKLPASKIHLKNYASLDCGAKIISTNSEASNTGALLTASRDEYMLNPCGARIWFIVELCEAIQAQRVELANFELFSSTPKNFTVAVANRFPTRDWLNVGRFIAEDRRSLQSFDLHPHLFGKYVRIDIHSHYAKEHFCPVSLFRVYGTSEFEAFETENLSIHNMDDFDDDDIDADVEQQRGHDKTNEPNIFKSASDAVLSIVKKAAEVLVKPGQTEKQVNLKSVQQHRTAAICQTPIRNHFNCTECNEKLIERIKNVVSCESGELLKLLHIDRLKGDLLSTHVCEKHYGIVDIRADISLLKDIKHSYFINMLPMEYVGALCQILKDTQKNRSQKFETITHKMNDISQTQKQKGKLNEEEDEEHLPLNLTLDKKLVTDKDTSIRIMDKANINMPESLNEFNEMEKLSTPLNVKDHSVISVTESSSMDEILQLPKPNIQSQDVHYSVADNPSTISIMTATSTMNPIISGSNTITAPILNVNDATQKPHIADVNIFNVPNNADYDNDPTNSETEVKASDNKDTNINTEPPSNNNGIKPSVPINIQSDNDSTVTVDDGTPNRSEPTNSWDIENLLNTTNTVNTISNSNAKAASNVNVNVNLNANTNQGAPAASHAHNGNNLLQQQKISGGPHTESVFIRLSNRIKTLELNMSLSSQYLEELSRRYKKQVEELQQTLTQQTLNVRMLEEENRRHHESEQLYALRNIQLEKELDELTLQVHACIVVIILVGAFFFLVLIIGILFYRSIRRDTKEILSLYKVNNIDSTTKSRNHTEISVNSINVKRRKSYEVSSYDNRQQHSETPLSIYKCANSNFEQADAQSSDNTSNDGKGMEMGMGTANTVTNPLRQRKMSIFYKSQSQIEHIERERQRERDALSVAVVTTPQKSIGKNRGDGHSWPNTAQSQVQAALHVKEVHSNVKQIDVIRRKSPSSSNVSNYENQNNAKNKKKKEIQRKKSAPVQWPSQQKTAQISIGQDSKMQSLAYDESLRLETDDLDNFLPTTDLKYNEFMPEGPRGYHCTPLPSPSPSISIYSNEEDNSYHEHAHDNESNGKMKKANESSANKIKASIKANTKCSKKSRRLSSPAFFKSPFTKSTKGKAKTTTPHESTSWEWHRLKKSASSALTTATPTLSTITFKSYLPNITAITKSASSSTVQHNNYCFDITPLPEINITPSNSLENTSNEHIPLSEEHMHRNLHYLNDEEYSSLINQEESYNSNGVQNINKTDDFNRINCNGSNSTCTSNSSRSNSSNYSNCSSNRSTTKKKTSLAFQKIFRKVF